MGELGASQCCGNCPHWKWKKKKKKKPNKQHLLGEVKGLAGLFLRVKLL